MRIVSLLPSATEIVCAIGAADALVGRSHECDHPPGIDKLPALTGQTTTSQSSRATDAQVRDQLAAGQSLYTLDTRLLAELRPDLILTQDLCGVCSIDLDTVRAAAGAMDPPPRVVSLDPRTIEEVLDDVLRVGEAIDRTRQAERSVVRLRERIYAAADHVNPYSDGPSVAFFEWTDPLFCAGHWTPQLIERAGGRHPLNPTRPVEGAGAAAGPIGATLRAAGKSATVTPEAVVASHPDVVIICPCGLSLERARAEAEMLAGQPWWPDLPAVRAGRVALVDGGQMFNRPGPRLVDAFEWLVGWFNDRPELIPDGFPWIELSDV